MVTETQYIYIILLTADWFNQTVINNKMFTYKNTCIQQPTLPTFSI
jgi:hypothetical protein